MIWQDERPARSRAGMIQFTSGAAVCALLLVAYYALTWRSFAGFATAIDTCDELFCDFASFYYPMGEAVFRTGLPVPGFVYSPFIATLLAVFPPLGLKTSLVLWGSLQVLCVILCLLLFRRLVPAGLPIQLLFVALALSSFPLLHNLLWGQVGIVTLALLLGLLVVSQRNGRVVAAVLLACAASFKFYPLIFLAPFVARRDTRFLLFAAAACGVLLFVLPGVLLGGGDTLRFYGALIGSYREFGWVAINYNSQYFPHVVLRLAEALGHDARAYLPLLRWIAYGVAAANMGLVFLVQRARLPHADLWSFELVFLTIPFVLKTSWPVDLVFLAFAQAFLAWRLLEGEAVIPGSAIDENRTRQVVCEMRIPPARKAVTLALLILSIVISNIIFFNLIDDRFLYGYFGFLFWANLLLLVATYITLLPPALQRIRVLPGRGSSSV